MVIEDYDWTGFRFEGHDPTLGRATEAFIGYMQRAGFEPHYGRQVVSDIAAVGLTDVRGEGRARVIDSSDPGFDFFRLSVESLRGVVVEAGMLSAEDADAAAARFGEDMRAHTADDGRDRSPRLTRRRKVGGAAAVPRWGYAQRVVGLSRARRAGCRLRCSHS